MSSSTAIADLEADRLVDGVYAVARKLRRTTRAGAPYLALELVDSSGKIAARVWSDVEMLDKRFSEGDAVRVLGRVERFNKRLQLDVRSVERASDADPAALVPAMMRDVAELDGFLEFLADELTHPGLVATVGGFVQDDTMRERLRRLPATLDGHHSYAGGLLEHTVAVATLCREATGLHRRLRADLLLAAALLHDIGRARELDAGPLFATTREGELLGHVHLGVRMIEERAQDLARDVLAELLHAVGSHHDVRAAQTAEAAVLYHANLLDAVAAVRPVAEPN